MSKEEKMSKFTGDRCLSIVDAMGKIDANARGILFIVDERERLLGSVTDGDIRRWLIRTGELNAGVENAMTRSPKYLLEGNREKAEDRMKEEQITALPILDQNHQVIDIVFRNEAKRRGPALQDQTLTGVPVVVMAGGQGTRLYPYTKILPKPLIPIGETPIIERVFDGFAEFGIDKFYVTVNYKKEMIQSYFQNEKIPYELVYVEESRPLGTGGGIKLIEDTFEAPVFVANCDSLILADYGDIYRHHRESGNKITVVAAVKNITVPYGVLHSKENGELVTMEEKPKMSYLVNTGMYVIEPETIGLIPGDKIFHMTHLADAVMQQGGKVGVYPVSEDSFLDMGEFDEMHRMEQKLNILKD